MGPVRRLLRGSRRFLGRCAWSGLAGACLIGAAWGGVGQGALRAAPARIALPGDGASLPVRWWCDYPLVEVTLDGRGPFTFLVDTGAAASVLDDDLVPTALRRPAPRLAAQGARGEVAPLLGLARVGVLAVGDLHLEDFDAVVFDLHPVSEALRTELDGVLGYAVFAGLLLELDYPERALRVRRGRLPEPDGREVLELLPGPIPRLQVVLGAEPWGLTLDSGSGGALDLARWPLGAELASEPALDLGAFTAGGLGPARAIARLGVDLVLGRHRIPRPVARLGDGEGRIGARLLRHFAWTFDVSGAKVWIEAGPEPAGPGGPVRSAGLALARRGESLIVWAVLPGSPAERAGARAGDRVLSLGGRAAGELLACDDLEETWERCAVLEVLLERGGERLELTWDVTVLVP